MKKLTILFLLFVVSPAFAGNFKIVGIGDSNSTGYGPIQLQLAMNAQGITGNAYSMASGGATSSVLAGLHPMAIGFLLQFLTILLSMLSKVRFTVLGRLGHTTICRV